jgi:hypothetical protein
LASELMKKDVGGKKIGEYWKLVQMPVFVGIALSVLVILAPMLAVLGFIGYLIPLYIGWIAVKNNKYSLKHAAIAGGIAGVVTGFVGGIISAIWILSGFGMSAELIAAGYGAGYGAFAAGAAVTAIIIAPIMGAIVDGILAAVGAFAAENV